MNKEFISVTGLGIGEETKGATVEWLSREKKAHTVIRSGGCQAGHHIVNEENESQMFSHFGCGTFEGTKTHLLNMVINPVDLFTEGLELEEKGIKNVFDMITIDENCISITPFHGAISRLREVLRPDGRKGTVGKGVGDAIKDSTSPDLVIRAGEFFADKEILRNKIENIRQYKIKQAKELIEKSILTEMPARVKDAMEVLNDESMVETTVTSFVALAKFVKIVGEDFLNDLLTCEGVMVGEASHGALLHPLYGFVPHVTQVDPTSQDVLKTIKDHNYLGKITRLGVSRCYMTRHGAGPLVSFSKELTASIHETHNKGDENCNEWLGEFRSGNYDIVAMKYALEISGGKESFDGLKISYMDVLKERKDWQICEAYTIDNQEENLEKFFEIENEKIKEIKVYNGIDKDDQIKHQTELTRLLNKCQPVLNTIAATENKNLEQVFLEYVETKLELPVIAVAYGPKSSDRSFR